MVYGIWYMVYGIWDMVYGIWDIIYGIWDMVYRIRHMEMANGTWHMVGRGNCIVKVVSDLILKISYNYGRNMAHGGQVKGIEW